MPIPRLWLSVQSGLTVAHWPPDLDVQRLRVSLDVTETLQECDQPGLFRTSPVFPLCPEWTRPELSDGRTYYIHFFCFESAFSVIGRLLGTAPPDLTERLLFSLGLASLLAITDQEGFADRVRHFAATEPRSWEVWTVQDSVIRLVECRCAPPVPFDPQALRIQPYGHLGVPGKALVDEFVAHMGVIVPAMSIHVPEELPTLIEIIALVNELVSELSYATNPVGLPPPTLSEFTQEHFNSDPTLGDRVAHQAVDRLVQVCAALSYLSTQALSGAIPILERRSLIRRYSLLGIGSALLALTRIVRRVEKAFAKGAVDAVLEDAAATARPLPGLGRLPDYDPSEWHKFALSQLEGQVSAQTPHPKLPYFSARLGFRETEYTISAAFHTLAAGASPQWSLLTATHELVHGHVRNILSAVFNGDVDRHPDAVWHEFYVRFRKHLTEGQPADASLLDSIRAILFAYCCHTATHGSLTRLRGNTQAPRHGAEEIRIDFMLSTEDALWEDLESECRNISEILVHVLDLHYFYCSSRSAYIPLIWRSWSMLPQVAGDLRQYVLRSLLVVACKVEGSKRERFEEARSILIQLLTPLTQQRRHGVSTICRAVKMLAGPNSMELYFPFAAGLILVDLAHNVLVSKTIRGALNGGDGNLQFKEGGSALEQWFEYAMPGGFCDDKVVAQTAYLADRIARRLLVDDTGTLETETVTLFLACGSHPGP